MLVIANTLCQQHKRWLYNGHHQIVSTEIRLVIFFAAEDGKALYNQQKQDEKLTVALIMNSLLQNSGLNWRKYGKPLLFGHSVQCSSVAQLCLTFVTPLTSACQASLSITNSQSLPKLMFTESVMPSNDLILCCPLLLLPSIFPSIRGFSNESVLHIRWPKYWSFSFNISPSNEHSGLISFRIDCWISLQSNGLSRVFSNTTVQKHQFFSAQVSL